MPGKLLQLGDWWIIFLEVSFSLTINDAIDEVEKSHAFLIIGQLCLLRFL